MARGQHPNSRANLSKGHPFNEETARKAGQKSQEAQAVRRSYFDVANELVTDEDRMAQIEVLKRMALKGDIKATELLLKILKEYENKISLDASMVYEIVIDDEDADTL